jgi:DNA polymerase type B, organellar and viral.
MKQHKIKDHIVQTFQEPIQTAIKTAYFGGRVQMNKSGHFPIVYGHDLISAYPSAQVDLPSLIDCKIQHSNFFYDMPYSLHRVRWRIPNGSPIQPFPLRQHTSIYYENCGEGWYWYPEVKAALQHFGEAIQVLETYTFQCQSVYPFSYIRDLFSLRKVYKAKGNAAEKPLKLAYNSHYGKHAQHTERSETQLPTYQCYWYAGYITSMCRARVLDLALRNSQSVIAIATDGIFASEKLTQTQDTGTELGLWEENEYKNFFIVQPGVYCYEKDGISYYKSRGLRPREVNWKVLQDRFYAGAYLSVQDFVSVPVERFVGINTAVARNKPEIAGSWERGERELHLLQYPDRAVADDFLYERKRRHIRTDNTGTYLTYYGRVRDIEDWRTIEPLISDPFIGRFDPANLSGYDAELSEVADNPEVE